MVIAVAKHSPQLAQAVVDSGALDALVGCLEEFDPSVKEAAAWALGYIARHNGELAQTVVDAGAVPLLVLCVQEPELTLKRISACALSVSAAPSSSARALRCPALTSHLMLPGHFETFSRARASGCRRRRGRLLGSTHPGQLCSFARATPCPVLTYHGLIRHFQRSNANLSDDSLVLTSLRIPERGRKAQAARVRLPGADSKVRTPLLCCPTLYMLAPTYSLSGTDLRSRAARHSVELAEVVVEAEIFPKILTCLKDVDTQVSQLTAAKSMPSASMSLDPAAGKQ
eukprot:701801-Rhodomonas_salina.1